MPRGCRHEIERDGAIILLVKLLVQLLKLCIRNSTAIAAHSCGITEEQEVV